MILAISKDNYITVLDSLEEAERQPEAEHFSSPEELAELAANWPTARLVEIWNNLPGATPVKKFTDRNTGVTRIWKALQELSTVKAPVPANESAHEAAPFSEEPSAAETATPIAAEEATVAPQAADVATSDWDATENPSATEPPPTSTRKAPGLREGSKGAIILDLLKREGGATLEELMAATGWQKHSVRGFLAGTVNKKMGLALTSAKREDGTRVYSVPA